MPIINFTAADKMLAVTLQAGFYPAVISEIEGPKASKSGLSVNFFASFQITGDAKVAGKELTVAFTSGSEQASILGNMMWMPTAYLRQVYAAVKGIPVNEVPDQFDTDELKGQALDIKVDVATGEAGLFNIVSQFVPVGKGAAMAAAKSPF